MQLKCFNKIQVYAAVSSLDWIAPYTDSQMSQLNGEIWKTQSGLRRQRSGVNGSEGEHEKSIHPLANQPDNPLQLPLKVSLMRESFTTWPTAMMGVNHVASGSIHLLRVARWALIRYSSILHRVGIGGRWANQARVLPEASIFCYWPRWGAVSPRARESCLPDRPSRWRV